MRVGIFCESLVLPPKEGINVHAYGVAKSLSKLPDVEVLLIVCDRGWLDTDVLAEQPFDTLLLPSEEFYDYKKIVKVIEDYDLDVLQAYMVYFSSLVLGRASYETKKPMVVEFHDLEKTITPIYLADKSEIAFHDGLQRRAGNLASLVRIMSAFDYKYVNQSWPELEGVTTWMPVSIYDPGITFDQRAIKPNHVLFVGNTSYPPNNAAATFIEKTLAPSLPEVTFSLVGRRSERFKGANIEAHGMVDNLADFLRTHAIGLAPIFEGSGMKIKLLDYLSAGIPVLTTPLGAYGYPDSEAIIIEEDVSKWPSILKRLLQNSDELDELSRKARKLFLEHFDLGHNIIKLSEVYRNLRFSPVKSPSDFPELPVDQGKIYWLKEVRETPRPPVKEWQYFKGGSK